MSPHKITKPQNRNQALDFLSNPQLLSALQSLARSKRAAKSSSWYTLLKRYTTLPFPPVSTA